MKVEHEVPVPQVSQSEIKPAADEAGVQSVQSGTDLKVDNPAVTEKSQAQKDSHFQSFEELDADLTLEHEELLKPDSHITSHSLQVWQVKGKNLKLSALEATIAVKKGVFSFDDYEL